MLRQQIVLYPLSPRDEIELQFATTIDRIHFGLSLAEKNIPPSAITATLSNQIAFAMQKNPQRRDPLQIAVLNYKQGLDYVKRDWLLNTESLTHKTFIKLYSFVSTEPLSTPEKKLKEIVLYLQTGADNALIQAAIAKLVFKSLLPPGTQAEVFSTLCSYLFLYKGGLDFRGILILERPWAEEKKIFLGQYQTVRTKQNITSWLEFYVKTLATDLETIYQKMHQNTQSVDQDLVGKLNERQKTIMTLLDDPKAIITNRTVQKIFHVSQITASRDLTKLTALGLLFTQGKGRSVRYTRI